MALTTPFKPEVFISFAEEDNVLLLGEERWVDKLARLLEGLIQGGIPGARVTTRLPGNVPETDRLEVLSNSAAVVVVLSPAYLASPWLVDAPSRECLEARVAAKPLSTVLAIKRPVSETAIPSQIRRLKPRQFYRGKETEPIPLGQTNDDGLYFQAVTDLANALIKELNDQRDKETGTMVVTLPGNHRRTKVFLAETTDDLEGYRADVERYLDMWGIEVLPSGRLPAEPSEARAAIAEALSACGVFVQLLGSDDEVQIAPDGPVQLQLEIAERRIAGGLRVMQWRHPDLVVGRIASDPLRRLLLRETVRAESLANFKSAVKEAVEQPSQRQGSQQPIVFVDVHPDDKAALPLIFRQRREITWDWHRINALKELKLMCETADAVLVFWGSGASGPSQTRYYEFRKHWLAKSKKGHRLRIYDGPPPDKPPIEGEGLPVISGRAGQESDLDRFINDLLEGDR